MQYKYCFDPVAAIEYEKAYRWYQDRSILAADKFLISVEEGVRAICTDPHRYRNAYKNLHEFSIKKYPYYLIYLIDEDNMIVVITSVFHHKRNPKKKYKK